jgi:electron transport complex protein RnfA
MTDLLLIFLGAAYLENLLLWRFFDGDVHGSARIHGAWLLVPAALLGLAASARLLPTTVPSIPPQAMAYLHALAFVTTAMAIVSRGEAAVLGPEQLPLQRLRKFLPLLVANAAVLAFVLLHGRPAGDLRDAAAFCLGASLAFCLIMLFVTPLRLRIEGSAVPRRWRGLPIIALTACLVALALSGYRGALPW